MRSRLECLSGDSDHVARDWNSLFKSWAKPPSDTEEEMASRAARMIRDAINEHAPFKTKSTSVYATGSYRNNTNTRLESDIDVAVVLHDCFFSQLPSNGPPTRSDLGFGDGGVEYGLSEFRSDVERALVAKFGRSGVSPGTKAFNIHENSVRLDADAAVFLAHRRYTGKKTPGGGWSYIEGVEMRDGSKRIINWHEQQSQRSRPQHCNGASVQARGSHPEATS